MRSSALTYGFAGHLVLVFFLVGTACVGVAGGAHDAGADSDAGSTPFDGGTVDEFDAGAGDGGSFDAGSFDAGNRPPYDGGPIVIADFIAAMDPNSWAEIPNSAMTKACPPVNHYQCEAVTGAWGGGAYDTVRERLIIFGGGHGDSYVNTVFVFDLGPAHWARMSELPDALNKDSTIPALYTDKRLETCGLYPAANLTSLTIPTDWLTTTGYVMKSKCDDPTITAQMDPQQPRSTHTYGNVAFSSSTKQFYNLGSSAMWPSGQATSDRNMAFDFETGLWSRKADNPNISIGGTSTNDAQGNLYYFGNSVAKKYDPLADSWSKLPDSDSAQAYYAGAAVDTKRNVVAVTSDGTHLQTWDLATNGPRTLRTTTGLVADIPSQLAFEYSPSLDRYFAWSGTRTVYWLDPATWAWASATGGGDDPGPHPGNGVYGRMRYSPKYNVFVLVRSVTQNVMLFKPPSTL